MSSESVQAGELLAREFSTAVVGFHQAVAYRLGLSVIEWRCLEIVGRIGPITPKQLAAQAGLTTGAITGVVDRLEKAGYVQRVPNPRDRRSVIIHSLRDQEIQRQIVPIFTSLGTAMYQLMSRYSPEELAAIQDYIRHATQILREETTKVRQTVEAESGGSGR